MSHWTLADWVGALISIAIIVVVVLAVRFIAVRAIRRAVRASSRRLYSGVNAASAGHGAAGQSSKHKHNARTVAVLAASGASPEERAANRSDTLTRTLCLLVNWVAGIIIVLAVFSELGISLTPFLTSAGLTGIIIGLGAQSLIKDLIAGMFLVIEGQYSIGDTIDTGTVRGTVQEIGSRVTRLQSADGEIWYVRHGEISTLGNQSQGWLTSDVAITVEAGSDPDRITAMLRQVADGMENDPTWHDRMLRPPLVLGLTSFDTKQMVFTVRVTSPKQSGVERELRARAVAALNLDAGQMPNLDASQMLNLDADQT